MNEMTPQTLRAKGEWLRTQWGFENYGNEYIAAASAWEADIAKREAQQETMEDVRDILFDYDGYDEDLAGLKRTVDDCVALLNAALAAEEGR
jgi:hypothetical protein